MNKILNNLCGIFIFTFLASFPGPAAADFDGDALADFTERGMALWHVPGMSVAVVTQDDILFKRGFGRTAEDGQAVDEHTLFAIASTTKAMVAAGILMLVDEGKLSLDDPVSKHIPELHFANPLLTEQLNVRDLLAHRTGLPSTDYWSFFQAMPLAEQIRRLQVVEPEAPVRTRLIYQNTMFEITGLLLERLSGQRWHHFLTERLWRPIGMLETYGTRAEIGAEQVHVTPHFYRDGELTVSAWDFSADYADAAGSVWSSIHDMSLWAQFLLRGGVTSNTERLISETAMHEMFEPHQLASAGDFYPTVELTQPNWRSYGLAWFQQDFQGKKIDFHTGSLSGMVAIIGLDRAAGKAIVVLGNRDHAEMRHALLWEVMDDSSGEARRDWNQEIFDLYARAADDAAGKWREMEQDRLQGTKPSLPLTDFTGTYQNNVIGDVVIELTGRDMTLKTSLVDFEMSHWHVNTFVVEFKAWEMQEFLSFNVDPDGTTGSFEFFGKTFNRLESTDN